MISKVPSHPRNPETQAAAIAFHLQSANRHFHLATVREGDRAEWTMRSAAGMMGLAAWSAEQEARLQRRSFALLPTRDMSIDEVCAS